MKAFRLAGLLRVRDLEEQRAAATLAEASVALDAVYAHRSRTRATLAGVPPEAADAAALSALVAARANAHALLGELSSLHDQAEHIAANARDAHHAARADARALEKLHLRHIDTETTREIRAEQLTLDEIAIQGWRTAEGETR